MTTRHSVCVGKHDAEAHARKERARRDQYESAMNWVAESDKNTAWKAVNAVDEDDKLRWPLMRADMAVCKLSLTLG